VSESYCALCEHFTTKGYPEQAALGKGRCTGRRIDKEEFVDGLDRGCVLYWLAKDQGPRRAWVAKRKTGNS
jgi:hypothetical protein